MDAYWLIFGVMLLLQLIPVSTDKTYKLRMFITFLVLFVYGAFRVNYGYDYPVYEETFNMIARMANFETRLEPGYVLLNKIMPSFRWLLIVTSALTCITYYWLFSRFITPKWSWLGIVLLFLSGDKTIFFMFSGIRNAIAISIMILSLKVIQERRLFFFIVLFLLATQFHQSAYFVFPLVYMFGIGRAMTKKKLWVWIIIFLIMIFVSTTVLIDGLSSFIDSYFDRYNSYMEKAEDLGDNRSPLVIGSCLFMSFVTLYYLYSCREYLSAEQNVIGTLSLLFVLSYLMGSLNLRFSQYYILFFILSTINILKSSMPQVLRWSYACFVFLFLGYAFFVVYIGSPTFPYDVYESTIFGLIE